MAEVRLIDYSRGRYSTLIKAMRRCMGASYNNDSPTAEEVAKFRDNAVGKKHFSLLESAFFTFEILAISRDCVDQFRTHRHLSFHVESSARKMPEGIIIPTGYPPAVQNRFLSCWHRCTVDFDWLVNHGVAKEDAKGVLPIRFESSTVVSGTGRAFYEVIQKRLCRHAQREIKSVIADIQKALAGIMPEIYSNMVCIGCSENCGGKKDV